MFADRYYTTYRLLEYMTEKKFYHTGTLQINRKDFPVEVKTSGKMKFQEVKSFRSKNGYPYIMWKDKKAKKPVIGVSSKFSNSTTNVTSNMTK